MSNKSNVRLIVEAWTKGQGCIGDPFATTGQDLYYKATKIGETRGGKKIIFNIKKKNRKIQYCIELACRYQSVELVEATSK